ncbi:MAG: hypothetical protein JWM77_3408 [Rhodospirillales bacterium]|nr:hypothetical protein [Rhodospirillales bacterium]
MITLDHIYLLFGVLLAGAALVLRGRPAGSTLFWGLFAAEFLLGSILPDWANGIVALVLVALAARIRFAPRASPPKRGEPRLLLLALAVPALTVLFTLTGESFLAAADRTLIAFGVAAFMALLLALAILRERPDAASVEMRRLIDSIGWAILLPQLLATLGAMFATAGVGDEVAAAVNLIAPSLGRVGLIALYGVGMALFTIALGNAYAAFPVLAAGVGIPLLVKDGGDPAVIGAIGMLCGFCGTLCTPLAANFNLVPAALLELRDRFGVIRAQAPTGAIVLLANLLLLWALAWR